MTNSLQAMAQRREAWLNEKPQGGFGQDLRLKEGDQVYFQFVSTGKDGDDFIYMYRAHAIASTSNNGQQMTNFRYCLQANEGADCPYCQQGHSDIKERMSIWMYVTAILHASMPANTPPDKMFPQIQYQGRVFFKEDLNDFKVWHTSAWRESPWSDILKLDQMYDGLNKFSCELTATGANFNRRYKLYAVPNSPAPGPEIYTAAKEKCQPIKEILKAQLAGPVAVNPQTQPQQQNNGSNVIPWTPPGSGQVTGFTPFSQPTQDSAPPWEPTPTQQPAENIPTGDVPSDAPQDLPLKSMF